MKLLTAKNLKIIGSTLGLTLAIIGIGTQTASAHYVYQTGQLYASGNDCVSGYSEVSHGTGKGYSKSTVDSWFYGQGSSGEWRPCINPWSRPSGYLAIRQQFTGYFAPNWLVCRDSGWLYSSSSGSSMTVARTHSNYCGPTSYYTNSGLFEYNGGWNGGWLASGNHML